VTIPKYSTTPTTAQKTKVTEDEAHLGKMGDITINHSKREPPKQAKAPIWALEYGRLSPLWRRGAVIMLLLLFMYNILYIAECVVLLLRCKYQMM